MCGEAGRGQLVFDSVKMDGDTVYPDSVDYLYAVKSEIRSRISRRRKRGASQRSLRGGGGEAVVGARRVGEKETDTCLVVEEFPKGDEKAERTWYARDGHCEVVETPSEACSMYGRVKKTLQSESLGSLFIGFLTRFLLPDGYPHSVPDGYGEFVFWNISRNIFANALSVLGTQCMLIALGVDKGSFPLSGVWNWILKDGIGLGSKVTVATHLAARVDRNPKCWRLVGEVALVIGASLELLTPLFPHHFFVLASLGNLVKKGADAATGPSYRVFLNSFAIRANIGDISSRAEAQVVVGKILGLIFGLVTSALVGMSNSILCFYVYGFLAIANLVCAYRAVSAVKERTINWERLELVLGTFNDTGEVPTIAEANTSSRKQLPFSQRDSARHRITIGAALRDFVDPEKELPMLLNTFANEKYMIGYRGGKCGIMLRSDAGSFDTICAAMEALVVLRHPSIHSCSNTRDIYPAIIEGRKWIKANAPILRRRLLKNNWDIRKLLLPVETSRYGVHKTMPAAALTPEDPNSWERTKIEVAL